ncbi:MAG: hypothetical protein EOP10_15140 [Proteobacteria bacterium]|nr:MAG: hypothetical protein EOP10_15140 [Pseudomonadota bacterium]
MIACGADNSNSYTPTSDTLTTTAVTTVDTGAIHIVSKDPPVQSSLIDECSLGFDQENLAYTIRSNEELTLGGQTFEFLRPLATTSTAPNIDPRLFAVWKLPSQTVGQVTYTFEVEIRSDSIIYRNTCVR